MRLLDHLMKPLMNHNMMRAHLAKLQFSLSSCSTCNREKNEIQSVMYEGRGCVIILGYTNTTSHFIMLHHKSVDLLKVQLCLEVQRPQGVQSGPVNEGDICM